jgi:hypothetical protein
MLQSSPSEISDGLTLMHGSPADDQLSELERPAIGTQQQPAPPQSATAQTDSIAVAVSSTVEAPAALSVDAAAVTAAAADSIRGSPEANNSSVAPQLVISTTSAEATVAPELDRHAAVDNTVDEANTRTTVQLPIEPQFGSVGSQTADHQPSSLMTAMRDELHAKTAAIEATQQTLMAMEASAAKRQLQHQLQLYQQQAAYKHLLAQLTDAQAEAQVTKAGLQQQLAQQQQQHQAVVTGIRGELQQKGIEAATANWQKATGDFYRFKEQQQFQQEKSELQKQVLDAQQETQQCTVYAWQAHQAQQQAQQLLQHAQHEARQQAAIQEQTVDRLKQQFEGTQCTICTATPRDVVIPECRHLTCCKTCILEWERVLAAEGHPPACPYCRTRYHTYVEVFNV